MRQNLPVTTGEYLPRDGMRIVSRGGLAGIITFVNPEFVEASGYSEAEPMGAPHNKNNLKEYAPCARTSP